MVQIGNVTEINAVKEHLDQLREFGLVEKWELPYENILTRLDAAIFFLTPSNQETVPKVWDSLRRHGELQFRRNIEPTLSQLEWRFEFKSTSSSP